MYAMQVHVFIINAMYNNYYNIIISMCACIFISALCFMQVVSVPFVSYLKDPPPFMPQAIPKELADKLFTFHQHPFLWFAGQILLYLLRPNEQLRRFIADRKKALDMKKPYAGLVQNTPMLITHL